MYLQAMANLRVQLSTMIQDADAPANVVREAAAGRANAEPVPVKPV
jgi:hypothetical protein